MLEDDVQNHDMVEVQRQFMQLELDLVSPQSPSRLHPGIEGDAEGDVFNATFEIKLFCKYPLLLLPFEKTLKVHRDCTLQDVTKTALTITGLENYVPLDRCRLVKYHEMFDFMECSYEGREQEKMWDLLGGGWIWSWSWHPYFFLEVRETGEEFQEYKPGDVQVWVHVVNLEEKKVPGQHSTTIRSHLSSTVVDLCSQIVKALSITCSKMRVVHKVFRNGYRLLEVPHNTLDSEGFGKCDRVFVEFKDPADSDLPFEESKLWQVLKTF